MANLGSDDTPVKGERFELPAGARLDEDNGDLVIRDSNGAVVMRRDEAANEWGFEGGDLAGIGSVNTERSTLTSTFGDFSQEPLVYADDTDENANLSVEVSGVSVTEAIVLFGLTGDTSTGTNDIKMRLEGVESDDYNYVTYEGTTVSSASSQNEIVLGNNDSGRGALMRLHVGVNAGASASRLAVQPWSILGARPTSRAFLLNGMLDDFSRSEITQIEIFADSEATGEMALIELDNQIGK